MIWTGAPAARMQVYPCAMSTREPETRAPAYYGGQAVIEGVMMRGVDTWAVAARRPDGSVYLERHPTSDLPRRKKLWAKPMFRGMFGLVDSLAVGTRALAISSEAAFDEGEDADADADADRGGGAATGASLVIAGLVFIGLFVVLPNVVLSWLAEPLGSGLAYHVVEGILRLAIFLAYLGAISLLGDIRRVFAYHGAEHATIAAWEHDEPLDPERVGTYSTLHVRCGTNFLLLVMLIAIVTYSIAGALVPAPEGGGLAVRVGYHVGLRVLLLPIVAGLAYEGLRLGAGKDNWWVRALMKPGLWLQKITTKPFEPGMAEVAIRALQAVVPADELRGRTIALPSPVEWGADEAEPGFASTRVS